MEEPRSSTSELALTATGISLAGMLCLALADLLPWTVFSILVLLHGAIYKVFHKKISVSGPVVVLLCLGVVVLEYFRVRVLGREEMIMALRDIIVFFAVVRLVLPKSSREIYQIIGIAVAECILATVFTQSPSFVIGLGLMVFLVPIALYYLDGEEFGIAEEHQGYGPAHWSVVFAGIVIISTVVFYIIPRPSSTIIKSGLFTQRRTGFSEEVNLHSAGGTVKQDRSIALRILWTQGKTPETFYLAGSRLEKITPNGFVRGLSEEEPFKRSASFSDRLTIYPTGISARNVFFPFSLSAAEPGRIIKEGKNYYFKGEVPPVYDIRVSRSPMEDEPCTIVVPQEIEGVAALGREMAGNGSVSGKVRSLTEYLLKTHAYSLDGADISGGDSPINWFVFDGRKGNCEYFASALATMIRGCGIPARVVTGFFVHEFNTSGEYFIVRSSDAHAWVEYWDGSWHIADATPRPLSLVRKHSSLLDTLRFRWVRWVIEYSLEDQMRLAGIVFFTSQNIEHEAGYALYVVAGIIMAAVLIWFVRISFRSRFVSAYTKVVRAFSKKGVVLSDHDSHEEHRFQVARQWKAVSRDFDAFVDDYLAWRFGGRKIDISDRTESMIRKIRSTEPPKES